MTRVLSQFAKCVLAFTIPVLLSGCRESDTPKHTTVELERFGDVGIGSGQIRYAETNNDVWELAVDLEGLQPRQYYRLALNALVPDSLESDILGNLDLEGWPSGDFYFDPQIGQQEGYWDFDVITTGDDGTFAKTYRLPLPAKQDHYSVKFFVKEHYQAGNVLLQNKSVRFVVRPSRKEQVWTTALIGGGIVVLLIVLVAVTAILRRRETVEEPQTGGSSEILPDERSTGESEKDNGKSTVGILLDVESWRDLAIGLEFDIRDGKLLYWVVTPPPQFGGGFRKKEAVQLPLKGARWKKLLQLVAESEDGKSASEKEVIIHFGYAKDDLKHARTLNQEDIQVLKTVHHSVTGAITDLNRKLRKSCRDSGVQVRKDGPKYQPPMSVGEPGLITTEFTVRCLLKSQQNGSRRCFGEPK